MIHVASVAEWLVAMDLVWRYADASGRPAWRGLAWAMLPLHGSSLCACTYHLFFNAPSLSSLVVLQAALTCFGNVTLFLATLRIAQQYENAPPPSVRREPMESDSAFLLQSLALSIGLSALIKYGSLQADALFEPSLPLALSIIALGTGATGAALAARSQQLVDGQR